MNNHNAKLHLENGGTVLVRICGVWVTASKPAWSPDRQYIQDDKYVEIRKALAEGREAEFQATEGRWVRISMNYIESKWQMPFIHDISRYKVVSE